MFEPNSLPPMVTPSSGSTLAFVVVVLAVAGMFIAAVSKSASVLGHPRERVRRTAAVTALSVAALMATTAMLARTGVLRHAADTPLIMAYLAGCNGLALIAALSPLGRRVARSLPLAALVTFQAFRLPLELVLHRWYEEGVIPVQMTYSGHNFDIISGLAAAVVGLLIARGTWGIKAAWGFGILGSALLLTVIAIAVMSSPLPLRTYHNDPTLQLAFYAPYTWIVPICVAGALFGHVVLFRRLLQKPATSA